MNELFSFAYEEPQEHGNGLSTETILPRQGENSLLPTAAGILQERRNIPFGSFRLSTHLYDMKYALLALLTYVGTFCHAQQRQAILVDEFIYDKAPFPSCHASTLAETPGGLVAAWFGGTHENNPDVGIWFSELVKGKWTAPREVANGVQADGKRFASWNPVLFQMPKKGNLLLFYKVGPSPSTWWGMLIRSADGGKTWSKPERLPEGIYGPIKNKPELLKDGTLICPTSSEDHGWRVHFEYTKDEGKTWTRSEAINDGKEFSAIQPSVLFLKDGRLQILCRSKNNAILEAFSSDQGKTWTALTKTELPNPNSGTDAVTLKDGRQALVYNHTKKAGGTWGKERTPLNLAISPDGQKWYTAAVLEKEPGEYSYPAIIQTKDGLIHLTYTWKREKIKHVVVDPKKADLLEIRDGIWPEK